MTATTTARRVFIAPVAEPLNGAWHDLSDYASVEDLTAAALAAIAKTPANNFAEELDCSDVEGFGDLFTGHHYIGVTEAWDVHAWLKECEALGVPADAALAWAANLGERPSADDVRDAYLGEYDSMEDYAAQYVDDAGLLAGASDLCRQYFDYAAFARDLELGGDVVECGGYYFNGNA